MYISAEAFNREEGEGDREGREENRLGGLSLSSAIAACQLFCALPNRDVPG